MMYISWTFGFVRLPWSSSSRWILLWCSRFIWRCLECECQSHWATIEDSPVCQFWRWNLIFYPTLQEVSYLYQLVSSIALEDFHSNIPTRPINRKLGALLEKFVFPCKKRDQKLISAFECDLPCCEWAFHTALKVSSGYLQGSSSQLAGHWVLADFPAVFLHISNFDICLTI